MHLKHEGNHKSALHSNAMHLKHEGNMFLLDSVNIVIRLHTLIPGFCSNGMMHCLCLALVTAVPYNVRACFQLSSVALHHVIMATKNEPHTRASEQQGLYVLPVPCHVCGTRCPCTHTHRHSPQLPQRQRTCTGCTAAGVVASVSSGRHADIHRGSAVSTLHVCNTSTYGRNKGRWWRYQQHRFMLHCSHSSRTHLDLAGDDMQ